MPRIKLFEDIYGNLATVYHAKPNRGQAQQIIENGFQFNKWLDETHLEISFNEADAAAIFPDGCLVKAKLSMSRLLVLDDATIRRMGLGSPLEQILAKVYGNKKPVVDYARYGDTVIALDPAQRVPNQANNPFVARCLALLDETYEESAMNFPAARKFLDLFEEHGGLGRYFDGIIWNEAIPFSLNSPAALFAEPMGFNGLIVIPSALRPVSLIELSATHELYAGQKGATSTPKRLRKFKWARHLAQQGVDPETIRQQTGWFKGRYDEEWRFEISDAFVKVLPLTYNDIESKGIKISNYGNIFIKVNLEHVISGNTLLHEYPQLRTLQVQFTSLDADTRGEYDSEDKVVTVNQVDMSHYEKVERFIAAHPNSQELKRLKRQPLFTLTPAQESTLIHEIQHAIQDLEGFYEGGSPDMFEPRTQYQGIAKIDSEYFGKYPDLAAAWNKVRRMGINGSETSFGYRNAVTTYQELANQYGYARAIQQHIKKMQERDDNSVEEFSKNRQYLLLAGEIESRDVQARRFLTNQKGTFALLNAQGKVRAMSRSRSEAEAMKQELTANGEEVEIVPDYKARDLAPYSIANVDPHRAIYRKNGKMK